MRHGSARRSSAFSSTSRSARSRSVSAVPRGCGRARGSARCSYSATSSRWRLPRIRAGSCSGFRAEAAMQMAQRARAGLFLYRRGFADTETTMSEGSDSAERIDIHRGLKGVYFDRSQVCFIDGRAGELLYRGYSIHDLAERSTFEETCYLLLHGELPTRDALARFDAELKAARELPSAIYDIIRAIKGAHPMDVLRTAASALAAFDPETADNSREATLRKGVRLTSQVPMVIAAHDHIRNGREPVAPDRSLSHAANFLWMLKGAKPRADAARLMDIDMI